MPLSLLLSLWKTVSEDLGQRQQIPVSCTGRCFCSGAGLRTSLATRCLNECEVYVGARLFSELCQGKSPSAQVLLSLLCPEHASAWTSSSQRTPGTLTQTQVAQCFRLFCSSFPSHVALSPKSSSVHHYRTSVVSNV